MVMVEGIVKNWKTSFFGLILIGIGVYLLLNHAEQIENALALIIGGISQLFAKDGATKSEYIKEKEDLKNEIVEQARQKIHYLSVDELRAELDKRGR